MHSLIKLGLCFSLHGMFLCSNTLFGCDFHNYYLGINPNFNRNGAGLRYSFRSYSAAAGTHTHSNGELHKHIATEQFHSEEIWGRLYAGKKMQFSFYAPYWHGNSSNRKTTNGIGDFSVLGQYQVFHSTLDSSGNSGQRLFLGGGIKFPTGKTKESHEGFHNQTGTGSRDILLIGSYLKKVNKIGFIADFSYQIHSVNKYNYRYADRFSLNTNMFYTFLSNSFTIIGNGGITYEYSYFDRINDVYQANTGNNILTANIGLETFYKNISLSLLFQKTTFDLADNLPSRFKHKITCGFSIYF